MKRMFLLLILSPLMVQAKHHITSQNVKSLEVICNNDFTALPVLTLGSDDVLSIGFDELSHNYHRFIYRLEPCNPDWTPTEGLFESDWLEGFNDQPIDNYENSLNTNVLYTHYKFQFPNEQTQPRISGNYRLHILDDDEDMQQVACIEFMVVEPLMNVGISVSTNTDIDFQQTHQQVAMTVNFNNIRVNNVDEQLQTIVMQNGREDNMKTNIRPNFITPTSLRWEHNRQLIFEAGNEYHKYEILDPSHTTMGLAQVNWNEKERRYHAYPYPCEPRRSYIYDEDVNGAFLLRNSDNYEAERLSEYVYVHYKLTQSPLFNNSRVYIDGRWTTEATETYDMTYNESDQSYNTTILQKLGYYNYQILMQNPDGTIQNVPQEGSFFQTENQYQAFVYYKATGQRYWQLAGYQEITYKK